MFIIKSMIYRIFSFVNNFLTINVNFFEVINIFRSLPHISLGLCYNDKLKKIFHTVKRVRLFL